MSSWERAGAGRMGTRWQALETLSVTDEQLSKRISFLSDLGTGEMVEWICVLDKLILKFVKVRTSCSFLPVELIAKYRK